MGACVKHEVMSTKPQRQKYGLQRSNDKMSHHQVSKSGKTRGKQ